MYFKIDKKSEVHSLLQSLTGQINYTRKKTIEGLTELFGFPVTGFLRSGNYLAGFPIAISESDLTNENVKRSKKKGRKFHDFLFYGKRGDVKFYRPNERTKIGKKFFKYLKTAPTVEKNELNMIFGWSSPLSNVGVHYVEDGGYFVAELGLILKERDGVDDFFERLPDGLLEINRSEYLHLTQN